MHAIKPKSTEIVAIKGLIRTDENSTTKELGVRIRKVREQLGLESRRVWTYKIFKDRYNPILCLIENGKYYKIKKTRQPKPAPDSLISILAALKYYGASDGDMDSLFTIANRSGFICKESDIKEAMKRIRDLQNRIADRGQIYEKNVQQDNRIDNKKYKTSII